MNAQSPNVELSSAGFQAPFVAYAKAAEMFSALQILFSWRLFT